MGYSGVRRERVGRVMSEVDLIQPRTCESVESLQRQGVLPLWECLELDFLPPGSWEKHQRLANVQRLVVTSACKCACTLSPVSRQALLIFIQPCLPRLAVLCEALSLDRVQHTHSHSHARPAKLPFLDLDRIPCPPGVDATPSVPCLTVEGSCPLSVATLCVFVAIDPRLHNPRPPNDHYNLYPVCRVTLPTLYIP